MGRLLLGAGIVALVIGCASPSGKSGDVEETEPPLERLTRPLVKAPTQIGERITLGMEVETALSIAGELFPFDGNTEIGVQAVDEGLTAAIVTHPTSTLVVYVFVENQSRTVVGVRIVSILFQNYGEEE